jgi:hypothetical protein
MMRIHINAFLRFHFHSDPNYCEESQNLFKFLKSPVEGFDFFSV